MDDEHEIDCYSYYHFTANFTRMIDDVILPTNMKVKIEFMAMDNTTEAQIDRAFTKIKYWLDNVVDKSIIFAQHNATAIRMFFDESGSNTIVANMPIITPDEPDDQHMAAIFQAKLQALAAGSMAFGPVSINTESQLGLSFEFIGDSSAVLPDADDWFAERRFFDKPWWDRDDGSTLDTVPLPDADLSVKPSYAFSFDFLEPKRPTAGSGTIVRHEFRPTVIDGGKSKE